MERSIATTQPPKTSPGVLSQLNFQDQPLTEVSLENAGYQNVYPLFGIEAVNPKTFAVPPSSSYTDLQNMFLSVTTK